MVTLQDWLDAARPKTLGAAIAPVILGTALGYRLGGSLHLGLALCTLGSCIALQVATNWFNDAIDCIKGSDTAARVGPRRITASGIVTPRAVIQAAAWALVVATLLALPLISARGWPIIAIGIPSLYFCYGYTGGPAPLAYRGLGELFVMLFFGLIAVTGSAYVQTGHWHSEAIIAGLQIGALSTVLIAINNLRDLAEDRSTGKRTLAVRFGITFARIEITTLMALAYGLGTYWGAKGLPLAATLPLLVLFGCGLALLIGMWKTPPSAAYNRYLAVAGAQLVSFALALTIGLLR
jgi:1,4-dihydroxy-2-naphthoate octaprenyltransferase